MNTTKRLFDLGVSLIVILFLLVWFLPIVLLCVFISIKESPIFIQERVGHEKKIFKCFKIKTMVEKDQNLHINKFCLMLRKLAIDELPQFFNVLIGNMSIVGPRPYTISDDEKFRKVAENFDERYYLKPGITGLAQSKGYKGFIKNDTDILERSFLDLEYVEKHSLYFDITIMINTLIFIIKQNKS
ncbi:sugar transferase [Chryseobacterium sp. EO14]|uniref:sugar transferase n=1 Tax=Chryseobacterium sp. EO14 TaxID=2950551 RepID=UPI00210AEEA2|nr:sugar transferase [Chryseobacterium sp. EO14]MCQ4142449.1 sugar transferase [Chryseobacterium sp. EO14]